MTKSHTKNRSIHWTFIVSAALLIVAIIGIQPTIAALTRHYSKLEVEIRKPIEQFDDSKLPSFRRKAIAAAIEQYMAASDVGTDEWIHRRYEEKDAAPGLELALEDAATLITYYSDPRDQIPHTPEVCYRQDGTVVHSIKTINVEVPNLPEGKRTIRCRLLDMEQPAGRIALIYVFCCEGEYYDDRETARLAIAMPGNKYTYFAKIESIVAMRDIKDFDLAVERAKRLMAEILPVLANDHLPTKEQISR